MNRLALIIVLAALATTPVAHGAITLSDTSGDVVSAFGQNATGAKPAELAGLAASDWQKPAQPGEDLLYADKDRMAAPAVPEPAALAIWSIFGVAAAAGAARRRRPGRWSDADRKAIHNVIERHGV